MWENKSQPNRTWAPHPRKMQMDYGDILVDGRARDESILKEFKLENNFLLVEESQVAQASLKLGSRQR